jgi:putative transposase
MEYLTILKDRCSWYGLDVYGYCLMTNHVHIVVVPAKENSLSSGIGYSHRLYSQRFNKQYDRVGHLWESRFYSCPLDEPHFIRALIYTDRNPVRAGIVKLAQQYPWSSARAHAGIIDSAGLINLEKWSRIAESYDWNGLIRQEENEKDLKELREHTYMGKSFVKKQKLG